MVALRSLLAEADFQSPWFVDLATDLTSNPIASGNFPFTALIADSAAAAGITSQALWFGIFLGVGLAVGAIVSRSSEWLGASLFAVPIVLLVGFVSDLYPTWPVVVVSMGSVGLYGADRMQSTGGL